MWRKLTMKHGILPIVVIFAFSVPGCSSFTKEGPVEAKSAEIKPSTPKIIVKKEVKAEPEKKKIAQEPEVEVIPRKQAAQPEIKLEPLPAEKSNATEMAAMPDAAQVKPIQSTESKNGNSSAGSTASSKGVGVKTKRVVETASAKNTFTITVGPKTPEHPFFGKGHSIGFIVDGVPGKELVLQRGKTYQLIVKTNPKHDLYISQKPIGWGSTAWTEGVQGMYTYKGTITFTPDKNTPNVLYYSCRNHPYMGGKIDIINPGQKITIKRVIHNPSSKPVLVKTPKITVTQVKQKLLFADMLMNSKSSKFVANSGMAAAITLQAKGRKLLAQAKTKLKAGKTAEAYADADKALEMLKQSSSMVPSENELQQLKTHHEELLSSIKNFEKSHAENAKRMTESKGKVVNYDKKEVERLKAEGAKLAGSGDYTKANQSLEKAQHMITVALQQMLQSQTIVYDLKFKTPKDEYEYELRRYGGYEELIPVAIEAKKPTAGAKKLMQSYLDKSHKMRDAAKKKAASGDYPVAIRMMQDATKTVRLALRMVGVMQ